MMVNDNDLPGGVDPLPLPDLADIPLMPPEQPAGAGGAPPPLPFSVPPVPAAAGATPAAPAPAPGGAPAGAAALPAGPLLRDRIVILGRRKSGKTVFLARLYERLWNSKGHIHMAAVDGNSHVQLLKEIDAMSKRQWPAATEGLRTFKLEVTFHGQKFLLLAPDYPGEVFRKAFMENSDEPLVRELLDNIDRAAALIVMVDPSVALQTDLIQQADQDFGLVAAVNRLRDWPGAEHVPVAVVVTKCDRYREAIEAEGGFSRFVRDRFFNLYRAAVRDSRVGMAFACAAVRTRRDGLGAEIPDLTKAPKGLIEPLEFCLTQMQRRKREEAESGRMAAAAAAAAAAVAEEEAAGHRSMWIGLGLVGLAVAIAAGVLFVLLSGGR